MVAGRNREIRALQQKMAGNQGGTARQQERMDYLQGQQGSVGNPERQARRDNYLIRQSQRQPQTGGPLQEAMGPGGQDAIRTQQPYQGGQMSNGGTTWNGQPPRAMDGSPQAMGMQNQGELNSYNDYRANLAKQYGQQGQAQSGNLQIDPNNVPQEWRDKLAQSPLQRPTPGQVQPMQRPTMGGQAMDPGFARERYNPGPDYFQGEGMGANRFSKFGSPPSIQQPVQGNQIAGGGTSMDRFSKPGYQAYRGNVEGNQIRGGGSPGISRRRVNTNRGQSAGVLAPPPGKIVPY